MLQHRVDRAEQAETQLASRVVNALAHRVIDEHGTWDMGKIQAKRRGRLSAIIENCPEEGPKKSSPGVQNGRYPALQVSHKKVT